MNIYHITGQSDHTLDKQFAFIVRIFKNDDVVSLYIRIVIRKTVAEDLIIRHDRWLHGFTGNFCIDEKKSEDDDHGCNDTAKNKDVTDDFSLPSALSVVFFFVTAVRHFFFCHTCIVSDG